VKIALVGAGMAVGPYLASLRELAARVDVHWVVGQSPARAERAAGELAGARVTTNLDDVLGDASVAEHVVAVCRDGGVRLGVMLQHRMREASRAMTPIRIDGPVKIDGPVRVEADPPLKVQIPIVTSPRPGL